MIEDGRDRKDGTKTAHVGHQRLDRYGKTDNGMVTVTTVWAGRARLLSGARGALHPARHFVEGNSDPGAGPGPTAPMPALVQTPPGSCPGAGRMTPGTGARWCAFRGGRSETWFAAGRREEG